MAEALPEDRLMAARPGHIVPAFPGVPPMSPVEFLQKTLAAIKRRRGLIHGNWKGKGRVCALGAFGACHDGTVIPGKLATELQEYNDSMPKASPERRRQKVILWIEARLKELS